MLEAVQKYDVDGVHFDDFFYPYPEDGQDFPDDASFARVRQRLASRADWRRDNVNTLVREMSERIKQLKPWVKFGISPFGIWRNAAPTRPARRPAACRATTTSTPTPGLWVREGWLDYIVPQLYWNIGFDMADYAKLLPWWSSLVKGTRVQLYIGQGDYRIGRGGRLARPGPAGPPARPQRKYAVHGSVHFSAKQIRADRLGAVSRYRAAHYATPALLPPMAQLPQTPPGAPRLTAARTAGAGLSLDWRPGSGPKPVSWALYRIDGAAARLVATGRVGRDVVDPAPPDAPATYCLSGLDRSGNEGVPSPPYAVSR